MNRVYFSGSFDLFHIGHLDSIKAVWQIAQEHNADVVIGVNTDNLYSKHKEQKPVIPYQYRKEIIEALRYVDTVVPQDEPTMTKNLMLHDINIYVISVEYTDTKQEEREYIEAKGGQVIELPYYSRFLSSSGIKEHIKDNYAR